MVVAKCSAIVLQYPVEAEQPDQNILGFNSLEAIFASVFRHVVKSEVNRRQLSTC